MTTIYKYPVPIQGGFTLSLPAGAQVLTVAQQGPATVLWALLDTGAPSEPRRFQLFGTGNPIPELTTGERRAYIGTFQLGSFVFHLFEISHD